MLQTVRVYTLLLYMNATNKVKSPITAQQNQLIADNINQLILKLALQSLTTTENILHPSACQTIISKLRQINPNVPILDFIQKFITALFSFVSSLQQQSFLQQSQDGIKVTSKDYKILQKALQKSQEEIRKHYKVQQQLKIYLDNLQDKIQQLQDKLELESQKYLLLLQTYKELDQNHQKLLVKVQHSSQEQKNTNFNPFQSIQAASNQNIASRKTKLGLRNKMLIEKLQQRTRKINDKNKNKMLNITDDDINLQGSANQMIYKKDSIQRYKRNQNQSQIKQLTRSLQMKQGISIQSYKRKISKTKTDINQRQGRSNSILN